MRLLVTGSRTYPSHVHNAAARYVIATLDGLWVQGTKGYKEDNLYGFTIVEGGCPTGVDKVARWWAENSLARTYDPPFHHERMDADWERYGKPAGPIRNGWMIDYLQQGDPEEERLVIGFVDKPLELSSGTCNCIDQARAAKLPVLVTRLY